MLEFDKYSHHSQYEELELIPILGCLTDFANVLAHHAQQSLPDTKISCLELERCGAPQDAGLEVTAIPYLAAHKSINALTYGDAVKVINSIKTHMTDQHLNTGQTWRLLAPGDTYVAYGSISRPADKAAGVSVEAEVMEPQEKVLQIDRIQEGHSPTSHTKRTIESQTLNSTSK